MWVWLRDPVERTLSQYDFFKERPLELKKLADAVKSGELDLAAFAKRSGVRNLQSRYLKKFDLADLAFVGVAEQFELGLALLFGEDVPALKRRYNATDVKSAVGRGRRARIAAVNAKDMQLYAEGLRLFLDRVTDAAAIEAPERPTAAGSGLVKRIIRKVA